MKPPRSRLFPARRLRWVLVYLFLLFLSFLVREFKIRNPVLREGWQSIEVKVSEGGQISDRARRLFFLDTNNSGMDDRPVLLLVHGDREPSASLGDLAGYLEGDYRILMPDLAGSGKSSRRGADVSARLQAENLAALVEALNIEKVHLLGESLGGVVAMKLADAHPDLIRSLILVSSPGVQEFEFLGERRINQSFYFAQWLLFSALQELTPHFGLFDSLGTSRRRASILFHTDLRPVRDSLRRYRGAALIIHGRDDGVVPLEAAFEHRRIIPQSRFVEFDGGHELIRDQAGKVSAVVARFVRDVGDGRAPVRSNAPADRGEEAAASAPFTEGRTLSAKALMLAGLALAVATLVSEDLTCIAAGVLVSRGLLPFWAATLACLSGIVIGDILLVLLGRALRRFTWESSLMRFIVSPDAVLRGERWIERKGPLVALISRFTPGTRLATFLAAGLMGVSVYRFSLYFILAASLWTPTIVGLSATMGVVAIDVWSEYDEYALYVLAGMALFFVVVFRTIVPLFTHRGRRLFKSMLIRLTHWEFWPPWLFYAPVVLYVTVWLGLRHRNSTLFTAVNPAMPAGGFLGESKSGILTGLRHANAEIARWCLLPGDERAEQRFKRLKRFMEDADLQFPIVLKPDVGERGSGVEIVRSAERALERLRIETVALIVQEFVEGPEFGIFYVRRPSERIGRIISVTEKQNIILTGDGERTIEEMILDHPRAVCMARFHLKAHAGVLDRVPAVGEDYPLVEIGTHCRGSMFLDGRRIVTPALVAAIDRIARSYDGFFFGRFDVRSASEELFRRGEGLRILELNGVTSEATHIYDPRSSLFNAYRVLFSQWSEAFVIASENRQLGASPMNPVALLKMILTFWLKGGGRVKHERVSASLISEPQVGDSADIPARIE